MNLPEGYDIRELIDGLWEQAYWAADRGDDAGRRLLIDTAQWLKGIRDENMGHTD